MGKVLEKAWALKEDVLLFFDMKGISCDFSKEIQSEEWVCNFAFAVDIMQKLNELNTKLQRKDAVAHELYREVKVSKINNAIIFHSSYNLCLSVS